MKLKLAAVLEPEPKERKRLVEALKHAGLQVTRAMVPAALRAEHLVILGPNLRSRSQAAKEVRQARPEAVMMEAQRRVGKATVGDAVLPLPVSPMDLKARLPELRLLTSREASLHRGPGEPGDGIVDPLTGFYTFAHFREMLFVEVKRARRYGFPLSLALMGLDGAPQRPPQALKGQLLAGVAVAVRRSLRDSDYPVQYRADRILVLMPHTNLQGAVVVSRRVVERVAQGAVVHRTATLRPTLSAGVAGARSQLRKVLSFSELVRHAQAALLDAQEAGGNRVEFWDSAASRSSGSALGG